MATIDEWPLPPNPSNPTTQPARCLAPAFPNDPKIYYAKFNLGIIGELDPAGAFREFTQIKPQSDTAVQQDARCEAAVTKTKLNRTTVVPNNTACTTLYPVGGAGTPDALAIAPPGPKNAFRLAYTSRASKSIFLVTP